MTSYPLRPQRLCQLLLLLWPLFISASIVTHLPGFHGPLPFNLETGYVGVDEVQFFYYFIESEGNPAQDPLLLWLSGGPGCSSFKMVSNMIFLDSPVGAGFSFSNTSETYIDGDVTSSLRVHKFIRKILNLGFSLF